MFNIIVDMSEVTINKDNSITIGTDELTKWDKLFGNDKPIVLNGDFLLKMLTENEVRL